MLFKGFEKNDCQVGLWSGERSFWPGKTDFAPWDLLSLGEIVPYQQVLQILMYKTFLIG